MQFLLLAPDDYISKTIELLFNGSLNTDTMSCITCVNITIIDNNEALEEDKNFSVILTESDSVVTLGNNVTTVIITDNDG